MKASEDFWRVFIAIELPAEVRKRIIDHIDSLRRELPKVRASWTRAENLHLTLKFLGDISVSRVTALSTATEAAARTSRPFDLIITTCGSFPLHGRPKVLWIGVEDISAPLLRLHTALEDSCAEAEFAREPRAYHPHLTIARLRDSGDSRILAERHKELEFRSEIFTVSELVLFRSELRAEGAKHTAVSRHQLT
jgi:2'-5' RNA ligase